jgi:antibiotic biosynthesis monooxygenase (ABM) superfamily enzyme
LIGLFVPEIIAKMKVSEPEQNGATVVITQRVREGQEAAYENWLAEIQPACRSYAGHLDSHVIRPISGLTSTYTFVIRFDTIANLRNWMESKDRNRLIQKARQLVMHDDNYAIRSGLDFWFTPEGKGVKVPVKWKQCLLTWSAIYPLVLFVPRAMAPLMRDAGVSQNGSIATLIGTMTICVLMTYIIMPHYTKAVRRWLYGTND